jgi:23S rRNA (cytidine1920-2'-O)/16S rRNA (cytidine1409-2'-O)-methyltransferase
MDRTNLRLLEGVPGEPPDLVTLDLSFISLRRVLGPVAALMAPGGGDVVALFKPQFELPRHAVGRGGLVLDEGTAADAARTLLTWASDTIGARGSGPVAARVRGATGNQEFFVHLRLPPRGRDVEAAPS